jgi:arylsulfatase A-like enzyme
MRRLGLALVLVAAIGAGVWWARRPREFVLPAEIRIETALRDLSTTLEAAAGTDGSVRAEGLQPSPYMDGPGGYRRALVAPPPATIRYRLHVPPGGALRLGAGVARDEHQDRDAAGIRFTARVDGNTVFSRVVNPAHTRYDRRWFDALVDLAWAAGRDVEVVLTTEAAGGGPLAGTPGWSNVRLIQQAAHARQTARRSAPSVLVLLIDALRADRLGCYGTTPTPSPTLDRLAARGLVFEQAIAQASWTMPAVTTILTGLYPRTHGVVGGSWRWGQPAGVAADADWAFLSDSIRTLGETAELGGVTTVGVVSNPTISRGTNLGRGFETFVELPGDPGKLRWPRAADINATFLRWLERNRGLRFLAYLHYMDVHSPYAPPEPFRPPPPAATIRPEVRRGEVERLQRDVRCGAPPLAAEEIGYLEALYAGGIRYWDSQLAVLLDALSAQGVADSTIVLVVADHGEEFQDHGHLEHGSQLYDETIHVPLVMAGPSLEAGRIVEPVEQIDVLPTVAGLLGVEPAPGLPGQNRLAAHVSRPVFSDTRFGTGPGCTDIELRSLRTAEWKLIQAPSLGRFQLYDLRRDRAERTDCFATAPEAHALAAALDAWAATTPPPPPPAGRDPRLLEKLRALGYVQ